MSAELAHFKCGRCSAVGHQTPDCILGYAQLWQSTIKVLRFSAYTGLVSLRISAYSNKKPLRFSAFFILFLW